MMRSDVAARLERIELELCGLIEDVESGRAYLPEVGKVGVARLLVGGAMRSVRKRAERIADMAGQAGGMDHSLPAGDR